MRNTTMHIPFTPTPDTAALLDLLLDIFEQRGGAPKRTVRVTLRQVEACLSAYYSQIDPLPRVTTNEQLATLEQLELVALVWEPGQAGHLLEAVALATDAVDALYALLAREPLAARRQQLHNLLLGNRFRVDDWRRLAFNHILAQLKAQKSPAPFVLDNDEWNRDLLDALLSLPENVTEELPYRVFSVRVFNDSKCFDTLKHAVARLARRHHLEWRDLTNQEILRELGLVPNPSHLHLYGPWHLVDVDGQVMSLAQFSPSVGIPAALAARVVKAWVDAPRVVCVENLTSFYELIQHEGRGLAALCLWGNPSPVTRRLLRRLADDLPVEIALELWADIDYGGLNILAQLRRTVSPRFAPYRMDVATLEAFAQWGQPLTAGDRRNLARLRDHPALADMADVIDAMLARGVKLEQEAVVMSQETP